MSAEIEIMIGPAASGKSRRCYEELVDEAYRNPDQKYILMVPEQAGSSMEQRILSMNRERTGRKGFFNIDIIGFTRFAYRVFEEQGRSMRRVLEDYGKVILIRSIIAKMKGQMGLYQGSVDRQGFIEELKSLFSEFLLFDIRPEDIAEGMGRIPESQEFLKKKLEDVQLIYKAFLEDPVFSDEYMVAEELPAYLAGLLNEPGKIHAVDGARVIFDGFTGFTAEQRKVIAAMVPRCASIRFTITMDPDKQGDPLFSQSREMLEQLLAIAPQAKLICLGERKDTGVLAHLSKHVFRFPVSEYPGETGDRLQIWSTENPLEELRVVAEDIRNRVLRGELRYRDVAVLTADLPGLDSYIDLVMSEYGLPYFSDQNRSFSNNPIIDTQMALLEILDRDFTYESVFSFIKTGIQESALVEAGLAPGSAELLENFVIEHGIRGRKLWEKEAAHFVRKDKNEKEEQQLAQIEGMRQLLLSILKPLLRFSGRKEYPVKDMIRGLLKVAEDPRLGLDRRGSEAEKELLEMGYPAEARAYLSIQEKYIAVLEKTEAILGTQKMTVHDLRETLRMGVREIKVGVIPPTLDSVLIGDLERTRIGAVKVLYIVNLNDGILPRPKSQGSILSDRDRAVLRDYLQGKQLPPDESEKRFREQFALYLAISKPTDSLVLTYSLENRSGKEQERSFLLGRIQRIFPELREEKKKRNTFSGSRRLDRLGYLHMLRREKEDRWSAEDSLKKAALLPLFPEVSQEGSDQTQGRERLPQELMQRLKLRLSISQLERYAGCPYSYFLQYILQLYPRREHAVREMDVGNILHRALELTFRQVKTQHGNDWDGISDEILHGILDQSIVDAIREQKPTLQEEDLRDGKTGMILEQLQELGELNVDVLRSQLKDSRMKPEIFEGHFEAYFEAKRPDGSGEEVRISGFVDRMDAYKSPEDGRVYIRILDYKTGDKEMKMRDLRDGRNLQLSVYLRILTEIMCREKGECIPAGMYYYHVDQPVLSELLNKDISEELYAKDKTERALRLKGVPNVSPVEDEESTLPQHYILELQEKSAVSEDRKLENAKVLPIDVKKDHQPKAGVILATTEEMQGLGEYSLYKAKDLAEQILKGRIEKYPTQVAGRQFMNCDYCEAAPACRFRKEESWVNYIGSVSNESALMEELAGIGREKKVPLQKVKMKEKDEDPTQADGDDFDDWFDAHRDEFEGDGYEGME
ncbi:MAG: exodeoxyribonuclease V subunit gamma [Eubacterium sp.]|nr:exodeoxyribonuclease V subunit gamma [Eubacterium sp.]